MALSILYRGPLTSCNYACSYCPFALRKESAAEQAADRSALTRFVDWVLARGEPTRVFFTPWGEALMRRWYREALVTLSRAEHVSKVAIQTNLHAPLEALRDADREKLALWCTYHPGQTTRARFLAQRAQLDALGLKHSIGVVGRREHLLEIEALRRALPDDVYLWINAFKSQADYYTPSEIALLTAIDPHFSVNLTRHPSRGLRCSTGRDTISVDGDGNARRCHFVSSPIGNLYDGSLRLEVDDTPCPRATCGCHIGYVHLPHLKQHAIYGDGLLERIPQRRALPVVPS